MLLPTSTIFVNRRFALESGGQFDELTLAYETYGSLNEAGDNAVLLCHGYTSSPHAAGDETGWWHNLIGPGCAIDTNLFYIISSNMIGSSYGSTGPGTIDPETDKPYGPRFPKITVRDMVRAQTHLLDHLGVSQLAAVIGNSYGGYLTFTWGVEYPDRMRSLVAVVTGISGRGGPETVSALRDRFAAACPGWNGGDYYGHEVESGVFETLKAIRTETLRSYGVETSLTARFNDAAAAARELDSMAQGWASQFDANALIALRLAATDFDVRPKIGRIKAPVHYVLSRTDTLFPPEIGPPTIALLEKNGVPASYFEIDSDYGHRAPGEDWQKWAASLRDFLARHAV